MCWLFFQPNDQNTFLTINSMKRFHEKFMKVKYIKIQQAKPSKSTKHDIKNGTDYRIEQQYYYKL